MGQHILEQLSVHNQPLGVKVNGKESDCAKVFFHIRRHELVEIARQGRRNLETRPNLFKSWTKIISWT